MGPSQEGRHEDVDLREHQIMKDVLRQVRIVTDSTYRIGDSHEMR